jgi:radical SAM superfamily enzyme YgiQ (UPF0313 family)
MYAKEGAMKILLVSPASGKWKAISRKRFFNGKTFRFSMLSLLTVAALSPEDAEITIVDEQIEEIPWEGHFDLVGITVMTAAAPRAYRIADSFRRRGTPVVLGGFHVSLNSEEALEHGDAVVVGEAYGAWEELLRDLRRGSIRALYHGRPGVPPPLPRHLIDRKGYVTVNATYASVGCTNRCQFCSITAFHEGRRRLREIDEVVAEISTFDDRFFIFVDDNLTQDADYARELLRRLVPLRKRWGTQASIDVASDNSLLALMSEAGCVGIFVGLETLNRTALKAQEKEFNTPRRYRNAVRSIHRHGIFVEAGIMFGFDTDGPGVFRTTLDMLEEIGIDAIQTSIVTPLPGTPLHEKMKGKITDRNWEHYDFRHVLFKPKGMTAEQLQAGADWVIRRFYSPGRILRRALRWSLMPRGAARLAYPLILNLAYFGRVKAFEIDGYDPAATAATAPSSQKGRNFSCTASSA